MSSIHEKLNTVINKTFPIPGRYQGALPSQIAELSRLLTNERGERSLSYLGQKKYLYAYLHYFMPWNLYRLCILLPELNLKLSAGDVITDLGCGPLTFVSALWVTRPDLRNIPLEFNCIDRVWPVLEAGKKFFTALSEDYTWKINLIKNDINIQKSNNNSLYKKASLVSAVNLFNEIYECLPHNNTEGMQRMANNAANYMHNHAMPNAQILTVEPGIPQSGRFISYLRYALMELGRLPEAPCTHMLHCPLTPQRQAAGIKQRWCHFAFESINASKTLRRLSAAAKLPKERLVFSFLLTGGVTDKTTTQPIQSDISKIRVISDAFPLTQSQDRNRFGRYGCSSLGLTLLAGEKNQIEKLTSLSLVNNMLQKCENYSIDKKSNAYIIEIK